MSYQLAEFFLNRKKHQNSKEKQAQHQQRFSNLFYFYTNNNNNNHTSKLTHLNQASSKASALAKSKDISEIKNHKTTSRFDNHKTTRSSSATATATTTTFNGNISCCSLTSIPSNSNDSTTNNETNNQSRAIESEQEREDTHTSTAELLAKLAAKSHSTSNLILKLVEIGEHAKSNSEQHINHSSKQFDSDSSTKANKYKKSAKSTTSTTTTTGITNSAQINQNEQTLTPNSSKFVNLLSSPNSPRSIKSTASILNSINKSKQRKLQLNSSKSSSDSSSSGYESYECSTRHNETLDNEKSAKSNTNNIQSKPFNIQYEMSKQMELQKEETYENDLYFDYAFENGKGKSVQEQLETEPKQPNEKNVKCVSTSVELFDSIIESAIESITEQTHKPVELPITNLVNASSHLNNNNNNNNTKNNRESINEYEICDDYVPISNTCNDVNELKNENYFLRTLVHKLKESLENMSQKSDKEHKRFVDNYQEANESTNSGADSNSSPSNREEILERQVNLLQDELIRVRAMLEQSQLMRKCELDKMEQLQNKLNLLSNNPFESGNQSSVNNQVQLINQITKLQESETMLKSLLESERLRVRALNEQMHQLHKQLQFEQQQKQQQQLNGTNNEADGRLQLEISQTNEKSNNRKVKDNDLSDSLDDLTMRSPRRINRQLNQYHPRYSTQEIQINIEASMSRRKRRSSRREDDDEKENQVNQSFNFNPNNSNSNNNNNDQTDNLFYEIIERLKLQGVCTEESSEENYKQIIVHLYKQRTNALKELKEFLFYLKQMQINSDNPLNAIKKIYSEIKSFKNEIKYLKQKNQSLKNELKMRHQHEKQPNGKSNEQQNETARKELDVEQGKHEKEERFKMKRSKVNFGAMFAANPNQYENMNLLMSADDSSTSSNEFDDERQEASGGKERETDDDCQEEDSLNERYTATNITRLPSATTMKTVTIPSLDDHFNENHNSTLFMVESDTQNDFYYFDQSAASQTYAQASNIAIPDEPRTRKESKEEKEHAKLLQILNERLEWTQTEKENIEKQLQTILNELKTYKLANNYEHQVKSLNEQLHQLQVESMQAKSEYNELKSMQNKAHAELKQTLENYEQELIELKEQLAKLRSENEQLTFENEKLMSQNEEFDASFNKQSDEFTHQIQSYEAEISKLKRLLNKSNADCGHAKEENRQLHEQNEHIITNYKQNSDELNQKIYAYEEELEKMTQQMNKLVAECETLSEEKQQLFVQSEAFAADLRRNADDSNQKIKSQENEIYALKSQLNRSKVSNEQLKSDLDASKQETNELRLKLVQMNEECFEKIDSYEKEIVELNKELSKAKIDLQSYKFDLDFKSDELRRLNAQLGELNEYREKYYENEHELNMQLKTNQQMKDKLEQFKNELVVSNDLLNNHTPTGSASTSYENIIENLKWIIQEQIALKNVSTNQQDVDQYKRKISDLQKKLSHEKMQFQLLDARFKTIEKDNQELRETLVGNSKKFTQPTLSNAKSRMDEINEIIERANRNAQSIIASNPNPSLSHILELESFQGKR